MISIVLCWKNPNCKYGVLYVDTEQAELESDVVYERRIRYRFNAWLFAWNFLRLNVGLYVGSLLIVFIMESWMKKFELLRWQEYLGRALEFTGYGYIVLVAFTLFSFVYVKVDRFFMDRSNAWLRSQGFGLDGENVTSAEQPVVGGVKDLSASAVEDEEG